MAELDYPTEREFEDDPEEGTRKEFKKDARLFSMLPAKDGESADNRLFFLSFSPNRFEYFKNWPDMNTYYIKLNVHFVQVPDESGNTRKKMVICERKINWHALNKISCVDRPVPAPFEVDTCAFCDHAQTFWDSYKEQRKAAGIENVAKEDFYPTLARYPEIQKTRNLAKEWSSVERFFFAVYDVAKATGTKVLDDVDEGVVRVQAYFGPDTIATKLYKKQKMRSKFWDFDSQDYRVVVVTRDNSRSARFCEYFVDTEEGVPTVSGEVVAYLQGGTDIPDPAEWVEVWEPARKAAYVTTFGDTAPSTTVRRSAPAPRPPVTPVTVAPAPAPIAEGYVKKGGVNAPPVGPRPATPTPVPPPVTAAVSNTVAPPAPPVATAGPKRPKITWTK